MQDGEIKSDGGDDQNQREQQNLACKRIRRPGGSAVFGAAGDLLVFGVCRCVSQTAS
jgi:hypothetical protein